ncbi:hypothetical protein FO519_009397, partial [Halicephalobus sp. NKZ332]
MGRISKAYIAAREGQWAFFLPALIVFYFFIKEIKVGEPFLYKYQTEFQNYTTATINGEIYPYFAYAFLVATVPISLFTDVFLYKPTMYLEIIGQIIYRFTLVFMDGVLSQQIGHAMWGIAIASEIGGFSYIYGEFEKDQHKKMTFLTRAASMAGKTGGYVIGQLILLTHIGTYKTINEITFYILCIALVFCVLLPRISWKKVVNNISTEQSEKNTVKTSPSSPTSFCNYVFCRLKELKSEFIKIYSNCVILKWSFWWAMGVCMFFQVNLFSQTLYGQVQIGDNSPLNGFADAVYTFIAIVFILLTNYYPINWDRWGETVLVIISILDTGLLVFASQTTSVYLMYICCTLYRSFYQVMLVIAQWNIARKMVTNSYGLVFGVNSFIAFVMNSILTRIVTDKRGLGMQVRKVFLVYATLHAFMSLIFLTFIVYSFISC